MEFDNQNIDEFLVSVVIPVYNTSSYLERCLTSLQHQTLHDIEIIMVDDGSTDDAGRICDEFSNKDSRFRVIHKNHEGPSAARNEGILCAKAKYIMFVDSDDWVEPEFCEVPFKIAKESGAKLVCFQSRIEKGILGHKRRPYPREGLVSAKELMTQYWYFTDVVVWNKLFDRLLFFDLQFPVGKLCEDGMLTHRLVYKAERIFLKNSYLYHHVSGRIGSVTNRMSSKYFEDSYEASQILLKDKKQWGFECKDDEERAALWYLMVMGRHAQLSDECSKILCRGQCFAGNASSWKWNAMFRLLKWSPFLFDAASITLGKRIR